MRDYSTLAQHETTIVRRVGTIFFTEAQEHTAKLTHIFSGVDTAAKIYSHGKSNSDAG